MTRAGSMMVMALLHTGCVQAAYDEARALSVTDASSSTTLQESTVGPVSDWTAGGPVETVTGAGSTSESASSSSTTTGELSMVPAVLAVVFSPEPITAAGTIAVEVTAEHAAGVAMQLNDAVPIELSPAPMGKFVGEIAVETGLANGMHAATFVPRSDDSVGEPVTGHYTVALPSPGSEALWDAPPDFGKGQIAAIEVSDEEVIAFGTVQVNDGPRCFLHRRDLQGQYSDDDFALVDADTSCAAIDLVIAEDASIWMLMAVIENDETRWRLMRTTWGAAPVVARTGLDGEVAHALAYGGGEKVVACGTGPSPKNSRDARVWGLGETKAFDYAPGVDEHVFKENITDCEYNGDALVMVGDVLGKHEELELDLTERRRMFILTDDPEADENVWHVPGLGPGKTTQSGATAVGFDELERVVVGNYACTDVCEPAGEVRVYETDGTLVDLVPLQAGVMAPRALATSPAGYVAIATTKTINDDSSKFVLQAFVAGALEPAWSYEKGLQPDLNVANALVVVPGMIIAGGADGVGYPAMAYVYP